MHHLEEARRQLHKNDASNLEQYSWRQHPTKHQLYGHLPPITKSIQARRTRHAGHCWRSRDELISDVLLWTPTYGWAKAGHTYCSYLRIRDVALKTCQRRWMIGRSGKRGSGISVLAAWHDDDGGISKIHGYLMPPPASTYILNIRFVNTFCSHKQLNDQTHLFLIIQFSINPQS